MIPTLLPNSYPPRTDHAEIITIRLQAVRPLVTAFRPLNTKPLVPRGSNYEGVGYLPGVTAGVLDATLKWKILIGSGSPFPGS